MKVVDVKFNPSQRPRNKLAQVGGGLSYMDSWRPNRPYVKKLLEFERVALYDTTVSYALYVLIDTLLALLGNIWHPDPEIQEFLRYNVSYLGGLERRGTPLYTSLYKMIHSTMAAGFSDTEVLYGVEDGVLLIEDFVTYHPATITIRTNKKGRLTEGEQSYDTYKSGIYQTTDEGEKPLPLWKLIHLTRSEMYGNYYGVSAIESIYKWHILKEALVDMHAVALDRFGNPVVAITLPVFNTNEKEIDPNTGEERTLTTQEVLERQISGANFSGGGNVLLIPQIDENRSPEVKVLTTGNNVGNSFQQAIASCDREIAKGLYLPYGLIATEGDRNDLMNQRQMEMLHRLIESVHFQYVVPIVSQSFHRLVKMNFTRAAASIPPIFPLRQTSRPEDRVALMQVISGLTNNGYFNPLDESDWKMVREMVAAPEREQSQSDEEFINTMLVYPRVGTPEEREAAKQANQQSANGTSASGNSANSTRKKGTEGNVRGKGTGAGRPIGTSAPKMS